MTRDEKVKSFIGWKSPDGKLEVIGIADKTDKNGRKLFKVTCTECSKDLELFPDGYFVSTRGDLERGGKPCGCSKRPSWKDWQYLILAHRAGEKKGFIVYGFAENFKGITTRLNLECLKDGYRWRAITHNIINSGYGCPKCKYEIQKELQKTPEHIALQKCIDICKEIGYDVIGFVEGYKNQRSRFEYVCKVHGKQSVIYGNFVDKGTRCGDCAKHSKGFYGYYPERKDETDFLYILNFNDKFIKVGRSFDVDERIKSLKRNLQNLE